VRPAVFVHLEFTGDAATDVMRESILLPVEPGPEDGHLIGLAFHVEFRGPDCFHKASEYAAACQEEFGDYLESVQILDYREVK
jgi:hypothetical protein